MKVRAQFDNADNALFPNQFVNAQLLVKTLHNVVTVPTAAIQRGAPGSYVYVINADNRVSVRPVNIGPTDGPMAAVNSGMAKRATAPPTQTRADVKTASLTLSA